MSDVPAYLYAVVDKAAYILWHNLGLVIVVYVGVAGLFLRSAWKFSQKNISTYWKRDLLISFLISILFSITLVGGGDVFAPAPLGVAAVMAFVALLGHHNYEMMAVLLQLMAFWIPYFLIGLSIKRITELRSIYSGPQKLDHVLR